MHRFLIGLLTFLCLGLSFFSGSVYSDSIYDRDIIVKDQTRAMKAEEVFKKLLAAYEDEDAAGFLSYVSDERFRQDYITFTDALYSDFRKYDIYQVDYWIERVVSDNVKQFLFVKWEKRFEHIDDGRQENLQGYSRFLFDEVNGKYLLIELAGNSLFGGSLQEWRQEVPPVSGSAMYDRKPRVNDPSSNPLQPENPQKPLPFEPENPDEEESKCSLDHIDLCKDQYSCESVGGHWWDDKCNSNIKPLPDLAITNFTYANMDGGYTVECIVKNVGSISTQSTDLQIQYESSAPDSVMVPPLSPGQEYHYQKVLHPAKPIRAEVDSDLMLESFDSGTRDNNAAKPVELFF